MLSVIDGLLIPQTVLDELEAGSVPSALGDIEYERIEADATELAADVDPGETAALAAASERSAVLLTDDLAARDTADNFGPTLGNSRRRSRLGEPATTHWFSSWELLKPHFRDSCSTLFSDKVARDAAWIDTYLIENGNRINAMDVLIAATARANDVTLVATDTHFDRVPDLDVRNPREATDH